MVTKEFDYSKYASQTLVTKMCREVLESSHVLEPEATTCWPDLFLEWGHGALGILYGCVPIDNPESDDNSSPQVFEQSQYYRCLEQWYNSDRLANLFFEVALVDNKAHAPHYELAFADEDKKIFEYVNQNLNLYAKDLYEVGCVAYFHFTFDKSVHNIAEGVFSFLFVNRPRTTEY